MSTSVPIVNLPYLAVNGCNLNYLSNSTLNISSGQVRDSTNTFDIVVPSTLTVSTAFNGVNGLDTGTVAASTWYAVFVLFDSTNTNPAASLISLSAIAPVMPSKNGVTFSNFRRVGWIRTDSSSHILKFYQTGNSGSKFYQWDVFQTVLTSGNATTYTAQSISAGTPPIITPVILQSLFTPNTASSVTAFRPTGSTGTGIISIHGQVATVPIYTPGITIVPGLSAGNPSIDYEVTSSSDALTLYVSHFSDSL